MLRLASTLWLLVLFALAACSSADAGAPTLRRDSDGPTSDAGTAEDPLPSSQDGGASDDAGDANPGESGEATYYNAEGVGACGIQTPSDYLVCAINDEQYSRDNCGRCVLVNGPKGSVTVRIIDKCPACGTGDLDLSQTAFAKIADKSAGRVNITWQFVSCP